MKCVCLVHQHLYSPFVSVIHDFRLATSHMAQKIIKSQIELLYTFIVALNHSTTHSIYYMLILSNFLHMRFGNATHFLSNKTHRPD